MKIHKMIMGLIFSASLSSAAEPYITDVTIEKIGYNGTGEGFVFLSSTSSGLSSCLSGGWVFVPDSKVMALMLTAKSTGSKLSRTVFMDNATAQVFQHVGYTSCKLLSVEM